MSHITQGPSHKCRYAKWCGIINDSINLLAKYLLIGYAPRDGNEQKWLAAEYHMLLDGKAKASFSKEHSAKWFELLQLSYFDPVHMTVIDPMHNILIGMLVLLN